MLRSSDVAPKAKVLDMSEDQWKPLILLTDQVKFNQNGSAVIEFLGIKNDYARDRFQVTVTPASVPRLDPVQALKAYIQSPKYIRPEDGKALFLTLKKPFRAISSITVARILERAIVLVGLGSQGFSAKNFRPSGATSAVKAGMDPDAIMKVGRWKSRETFMTHYVHAKPISSFTDNVLKLDQFGAESSGS